ncbi:sulfotransferase family 2 domain-containing protein [Salinisphaera sp.]|uniref:sulfotransferase family 2 domain-containing protein n=1 Tax=Salinisphaera sp. TaxID=1914330 RepID=UPI002D7820A7|nr:sulfotransferase family 2 domain-containing protein [Salinisphaera sp.]HET7314561.1 sulfotransferase family 2 domain-containing protein [Salinisphaera sp.]
MIDSLRARAKNHLYRLRLRSASFAELNTLSQPGFNPSLFELYSRTGYCFIHIPKNGGTTVERLFYRNKVGHRAWFELHSLAPLRYCEWVKFCVIRHPIDRFLSSYDYLRRGGRNPIDREIGRRFVQRSDLNTFVANFEHEDFRNQIMRYFHFRPQFEYILSGDGHCMVNKLLSFDRLGEEVAAMLGVDTSSISHDNKTPGRRTLIEALTPDSRQTIESLYARDFQLYEARGGDTTDFYLRRFDAGSVTTSSSAA